MRPRNEYRTRHTAGRVLVLVAGLSAVWALAAESQQVIQGLTLDGVKVVVDGNVTIEGLGGNVQPPATAQADEEAAPEAADGEATAPRKVSGSMGYMLLLLFTFTLAIFLGFELISKVPSQLHTPLMSGSNAISGITIVGALLAAGHTGNEVLRTVLGLLAVICASINVFGGYFVTNRMLAMFKHREGGN